MLNAQHWDAFNSQAALIQLYAPIHRPDSIDGRRVARLGTICIKAASMERYVKSRSGTLVHLHALRGDRKLRDMARSDMY